MSIRGLRTYNRQYCLHHIKFRRSEATQIRLFLTALGITMMYKTVSRLQNCSETFNRRLKSTSNVCFCEKCSAIVLYEKHNSQQNVIRKTLRQQSYFFSKEMFCKKCLVMLIRKNFGLKWSSDKFSVTVFFQKKTTYNLDVIVQPHQ